MRKTVFVFLATGFEELEAVGTIDVLRRGELNVVTVSVMNSREVTGAHQIVVTADQLFSDVDFSTGDMLVLPGGMPGASNLNAHEGLKTLIRSYALLGKKLAAICAAPLVYGGLGLLQGKKATSYPGFEDRLVGAFYQPDGVVKDDNIITAKGPGFAVAFGLAIVEELQGKAQADEVAKGMLLL